MKSSRKKLRGVLRLFCASVAALALALPAAAEETAPELLEPVGVKMDTAEAYIGEISKIEAYEASVVPYVEKLSFTAEGEVEEVLAVVGQQVKKGDVLATLDREAEELRMEELRRDIEALETNYAYDVALAEIDMRILETELRALENQSPRDDAAIGLKRLDMESLELDMRLNAQLCDMELTRRRDELERLEKQMAGSEIRAPFDGRVMFSVELNRGMHLNAYSPVIFLADDTRLAVRSEYISSGVLQNAHAVYALVGAQRYALSHVEQDPQEYIAQMLSGEELTTEFEIDAPAGALSAGLYAAVCVESSYVADALLVPTNALYTDSTGRYVYVVDGDARERRNVRVGLQTDWLTQIQEGLEEGAVVYVKN